MSEMRPPITAGPMGRALSVFSAGAARRGAALGEGEGAGRGAGAAEAAAARAARKGRTRRTRDRVMPRVYSRAFARAHRLAPVRVGIMPDRMKDLLDILQAMAESKGRTGNPLELFLDM